MSRAPIALVDGKRQLHVIRADGTRHAQTLPDDVVWGAWGASPGAASAHSWPTWSHDGQRLAAFRMTGSASSSGVLVMDVGGISTVEVADLHGRLPIYLCWSPRSDALAILSQEEHHLVLSAASPDTTASERRLITASPLFFTWADASHVAAYVGVDGTTGGELLLLDGAGRGRLPLPGQAVNFCAPVVVGQEVVYACNVGGRTRIVAAPLTGGPMRPLETVSGLVAIVPTGDGRRVLRATAPDGDATPYRDVALLDVETGDVQHVTDDPCLAFLWSPGGDAVVTARVDTDRNTIRWERVGLDGETSPIIEASPTRDTGFYLRFFEQYGQSHPLIDPTGTHLVIAGSVPNPGEPRGASRVLRVPLDGGTPEELGEGVFAVYGPAEPAP